MLDEIKGLIIPETQEPSDKEIFSFVSTAYDIVRKEQFGASLKAPIDGYPKDFGYVAEQEYYEEPWIVDLRSALARYFFCLHAKTNRTVKGRRAGNPHRVCINVVIGRKNNATAAKMVADSIVEALKRRAHLAARSALEAIRLEGKSLDTRTFIHAAKRDSGNKIVSKINDMADNAMISDSSLQPYYAFDMRYADRYLANELGGRQTLSYKKLKLAA
jgi:hypothetical protein